MNKNNFTVIQGGLLDSQDTSKKEFISAYVTNTRLMGVLGMYIHWGLPDNKNIQDYHQFFYFDAEEYGFETFESVLGGDDERRIEIENSLIGGLGGEKQRISLREACFLLQSYTDFNKSHNLPLPEGRKEYEFLLNQRVIMTSPEKTILMQKQSVRIESSYELINYFLMRCFGRDFSAARFLSASGLELDLFPEFREATFCKNSIDKGDALNSYICESLVEFNDNYYLTITNLSVENRLISGFERISSFRVSPVEASMMLARSEFISVYEMLCDPSDFDKTTSELTRTAMMTPHENGKLYMIFHPNNKHVDKKEYRLNEDVRGIYYVSDSHQLIAASYTMEEIKALEKDLSRSKVARMLIPMSKYEFQEPVLYEFIQSGFEDFEEFVDAIKE